MDVVLCSYCVVQKEKGEERVGVGGRGKYPGPLPHHLRKKKEGRRRKKQLADRKVPDKARSGERGRLLKIKIKIITTIKSIITQGIVSAKIQRQILSG
jgi:hypothetical protein